MKQVAVVVPTYKNAFSEDEAISLRHLEHYLGAYDRFYVAPEGLEVSEPALPAVRFDPAFFKSAASFNRLLLSKEFYAAFANYEYMLMYQLDCLVFSDRLSEWCGKGYDYIGAPWFETDTVRWTKKSAGRVGNGGLSLRRNAACIEAIQASNRAGILDILSAVASVRPGHLGQDLKNAVLLKRNAAANFPHNEDIWWSFYVTSYMPGFRVPDVDEALGFAFEVDPRGCFERTGGRMPFGCHAWETYQRDFWEPHLLT